MSFVPSEKMASYSSLSLIPMMEDGEYRNWAELPSELTSSILHRLGAIEILENAQKVCRSWRGVSKDPSMWRKIYMHDSRNVRRISMLDLLIRHASDRGVDILEDAQKCTSWRYGVSLSNFDKMDFRSVSRIRRRYNILCRHAVDRSQGGLVEIDLSDFGSDELLNYIADRSSNLRTLIFEKTCSMTDDGFLKAFLQLPSLEYLEVSYGLLSGESLKAAGQSCPNLKTLKLNFPPILAFNDDELDNEALAIAESMPELRHLRLFRYGLTNTGLSAILDGCPHLEHLDIRMCSNINLVGDLEKRCLVSIKDLRRPDDSIADHPLYYLYDYDYLSDEESLQENTGFVTRLCDRFFSHSFLRLL